MKIINAWGIRLTPRRKYNGEKVPSYLCEEEFTLSIFSNRDDAERRLKERQKALIPYSKVVPVEIKFK